MSHEPCLLHVSPKRGAVVLWPGRSSSSSSSCACCVSTVCRRPRSIWDGEAVSDADRVGATRAFYDDLAATYDLIYRDWDASITRQGQSLDAVLTAFGVAASDRVLDCACGIGTQTLGLAACGRNVTGADSTVVSVARARAEARKRGVRPDLAAADMRALPFGDEQFAAVICADNALAHLITSVDLAAGLAEMTRVLCSGGVLVASTRDYDAVRLDPPSSTAPLAAAHRRAVWSLSSCGVGTMTVSATTSNTSSSPKYNPNGGRSRAGRLAAGR